MTMELLILITTFSFPEVTFDYFLKLHGLILSCFLRIISSIMLGFHFCHMRIYLLLCAQLYIRKDFCIISKIYKFLVVRSVSGYPVIPIIFLLQEFLLLIFSLLLCISLSFLSLYIFGPCFGNFQSTNLDKLENKSWANKADYHFWCSTWISIALSKNKIQRFHHSLHH